MPTDTVNTKQGDVPPSMARMPTSRKPKQTNALLSKLRARRTARRLRREERITQGLRTRRKKRKIALAASASVMTLSTAAVDPVTAHNQLSAMEQVDASIVRQPAAMLSTSDALKEAMIDEEGLRLTVYRDVAGYPTVGIGHLVLATDNLSVGDTISEERALDFFEDDLRKAEKAVAQHTGGLPLLQHEFDALVDLTFNVGEGVLMQKMSPKLSAAIQARDYAAMSEELSYHHADGAVANGLVYRSERRTGIFLDAEYSDPRELRA